MGKSAFARSLFGTALMLLVFSILISISGCNRNDLNETDSRSEYSGENVDDKETLPAGRVGIGFLWTENYQPAADMLSSDNDFVDLIIGEGKLDVFNHIKPPVRVACISLALAKHEARPFPGIRETIQILQKAGIPQERVIIAYNPERQPGTPGQELDELVDSVRKAREMADEYGAPLLVGPGLREMEKQEHLYPELARHCDIWLIQSQRLQMERPTGRVFTAEEYRQSVIKITDSLRRGNPDIKIYVQIVAGGRIEKEIFSPAEVVEYARSIEDAVDAIRIYGGSPDVVSEIIKLLRE